MKRLLAKLPRSSSGSRELSASSSAAALPADIFDVSMTDADRCGLASGRVRPTGGLGAGFFCDLFLRCFER